MTMVLLSLLFIMCIVFYNVIILLFFRPIKNKKKIIYIFFLLTHNFAVSSLPVNPWRKRSFDDDLMLMIYCDLYASIIHVSADGYFCMNNCVCVWTRAICQREKRKRTVFVQLTFTGGGGGIGVGNKADN